ncbi:MAG: hypothetical protein CMP22_07765 [Rickettsiales bacterium]|nr:hypothetical protein [Rickettsiales bacterium]|tara:strand:+ start:911 stop:1243 length:333 start_codon:yes stop_codon:yes gene_type:complete
MNNQKRLDDLQVLIASEKEDVKRRQRRISLLEREAVEIAKRLSNKKNNIPRISDHALVRYLERVKKIDVDAIRKEILTDDVIAHINTGCKAINRGPYSFKIDNKTIITVY